VFGFWVWLILRRACLVLTKDWCLWWWWLCWWWFMGSRTHNNFNNNNNNNNKAVTEMPSYVPQLSTSNPMWVVFCSIFSLTVWIAQVILPVVVISYLAKLYFHFYDFCWFYCKFGFYHGWLSVSALLWLLLWSNIDCNLSDSFLLIGDKSLCAVEIASC